MALFYWFGLSKILEFSTVSLDLILEFADQWFRHGVFVGKTTTETLVLKVELHFLKLIFIS